MNALPISREIPCRTSGPRPGTAPRSSRLTLAAILLLPGLLAAAPGRAARPAATRWTLESVLHELDRGAKQFRTLTANVERTKVTVVVNDRSTETGKMYVRRDGKMRLELAPPDERTILRAGDDLYVYNPHIRRVDIYNLARHREMVDQFLLLGFGTSVRDLKKNFLMTLLGEQMLDGHKVVLLELTPKAEKMRDQISKIHLWIDEATWLPLQQQFFETGTQDYFVIRYSNVLRNASIDPSLFKPHWPNGTRKVKAES
jgi:outer membrane lipoprotein-sorting protein